MAAKVTDVEIRVNDGIITVCDEASFEYQWDKSESRGEGVWLAFMSRWMFIPWPTWLVLCEAIALNRHEELDD